MKNKLSILITAFALMVAVFMPAATAFAAQSDFYGDWEGDEAYYNASDDWGDYWATVSATEISFTNEGEAPGGISWEDVFICGSLVWDAEQTPSPWGGDSYIEATGVTVAAEGWFDSLGMTVGGDCAVSLELYDGGNALLAAFGDGVSFTGGYPFTRAEGGGEPEEELEEEEEENPKTSDINVGFTTLSSIVAVAGLTVAGIGYKKANSKR